MWTEIVRPAIIFVVLLYVPGVLFLRGLRARWEVAVMAAPLLTVAFYGARPILQANAGVATTWNNLFFPALVIGIIVFVIGTVLSWFFPAEKVKGRVRALLKKKPEEAEGLEAEVEPGDEPAGVLAEVPVGEPVSPTPEAEGDEAAEEAEPADLRERVKDLTGKLPFAKRKAGAHSTAETDDAPRPKRQLLWDVMLMSVVCGIIAVWYVFLSHISDISAFDTVHDNVHHLGSIQNFIDSGNWSSLGLTLYRDPVGDVGPFVSSGSFYPSAWHGLAAMLVEATGITVPAAANITIVVLIAITYPLGVCMLLTALFPDNKRVAGVGAVICLGFAAFPWALLVFGVVSPQTAAFALVPLMVGALLLLFEERSVIAVIRNLILIVAGAIAVILLNTTALFTVALIFVFCGSSRICRLVGGIKPLKKFAKPLGWVLGAIVLYIGYRLWLWGLDAEVLNSVVYNSTKSFALTSQAIRDAITMKFTGDAPQYVLMMLTVLGIGYLIYKRQFWLICPMVFMMVSYVISASDIEDIIPLRVFFTGYWYRVPERIAASAVVCCVPVTICGLYALAEFIASSLRRMCIDKHKRVPRAQTVIAFVCIVVAIHAFMPNLPTFVDYDEQRAQMKEGEEKAKQEGTLDEYYYEIPMDYTAMGSTIDDIHYYYGRDLVPEYEDEERAFSEEVVAEIGHELVLNEAIDGSCYAYGGDAVNTYFRYMDGYEGEKETDDSKVIRYRLCDISWDGEVQEAVRRTGAKYVVLYDVDMYKGAQRSYNPVSYWTGFEKIRANTPGFEVVLQEDDMLLLRITAID